MLNVFEYLNDNETSRFGIFIKYKYEELFAMLKRQFIPEINVDMNENVTYSIFRILVLVLVFICKVR